MKKEKKVEKKVVEKVEVKTVKPKEKLPFHLEIKVNDVEFKTDAKDLETALSEFVNSPLFPKGAKTTTLINISKGGKTAKRVWRTVIARRMLSIMRIKPEAIKVLAEKLTNELA